MTDMNKDFPEDEEDEGGGKGRPVGRTFDAASELLDSDQGDGDQGDQGEQGGEEGKGGVAGEIEFHYQDPFAIAPRDDQLSPTELKRLLIVQSELHKAYVDKQRLTRKERAALKEGKVLYTSEGQRKGLGGQGQGIPGVRAHPKLGDKAQFSGIDKQVSNLPNNYDANTNSDLRDALENKLQLRNAPTNQPRFHPKPRLG